MKKLIITSLIFANCLLLFGQSKEKKSTMEVGLNGTFLARNFFGAEDDITSIDDYLLYLKFIHKKNAWRMGLGGNINKRAESLTDQQNEVFSSQVNARIGYERRNKLGSKWLYYFGADLVLHYDEMNLRTITAIDDTTSKDRYLEGGAGPILGIQFMINDHIGISTEAAMLYFFTSFSSDDVFVNFPEINQSRQFEEFRIAAIAPTNIYISVKF